MTVGEPEKVRERIGRLDAIADSIYLVPPSYALPPEKLLSCAGMIAQAFPGN